MANWIMWTTVALVCMIGQTRGETGQFFPPGPSQKKITFDQLIEKLGKPLDLSGDEFLVPTLQLAYEVHKLLESTSDVDKKDPKLMGLSVGELRQLNTWNIKEWSMAEFERREAICKSLIPQDRTGSFEHYYYERGAGAKSDLRIRINVGFYCWYTTFEVFDRCEHDLAKDAASRLAKYEEMMRTFNSAVELYIKENRATGKQMSKKSAIESVLEEIWQTSEGENEEGKKEEAMLDLEHYKYICSKVLEAFALPFWRDIAIKDGGFDDWHKYYDNCKIVSGIN